MLLFCCHPCFNGNRPKQSKELRAIKPPTLLTRKEEVRTIIPALSQPLSEGF
jgi:hypothetical protein